MSDVRCPACAAINPPSKRFCGECGKALPQSEAMTATSPVPQINVLSSPPRMSSDGTRFLPGQVLAERYRMVGLLGKGGMGEVYRADDLKLGQPVALKFLPRDVEADKDRLDRFLTEVKTALRVTHPNVCRVFDIGRLRPEDGIGAATAQGHDRHFLSMEFVDGEDLASLLRRIGRLPEDKAVEIARQLCAGLQAAHDEGVLHRDLKPANVMIDGRGRAKITDFGLAGATAGITGREAQAGTPQYMAPEQFDGGELSVQTDLYSLGLVLYELFTGKRAFEGGTVNELREMHSSTPTSPSAHVAGLDPIIERAILRCVDPSPARRPKSAASLAAALPGGDPVAMAIAAGETPSPEMVARSGGAGALSPGVAAGCLAVVLVGLGLVWYGFARAGLQNLVETRPPAELRIIARGILETAGYPSGQPGQAFGFMTDADYFRHVTTTNQSLTRWDDLATVSPGPVWSWYRESPQRLVPLNAFGDVSMTNPPVTVPGMTRIRMDAAGRLQEFRAVPSDLPATPGPWPEPDWMPMFKAARLVMSELTPTEPKWAAAEATDIRRAWTKDTLTVEAGSLRGKPTWFRVVPEWRRPTEIRVSSETAGQRYSQILQAAVVILVIAGGAFLARRNLRQGRSDRRGASRLAGLYLALGAVVVLTQNAGSPTQWLNMLQRNFAYHLYIAALIWLFYLAVEPYVRRLWPGTLVAWTRVLEGRLRDPLVGRHILLGAIAGLVMTLLIALPLIFSRFVGIAPIEPPSALPALASTPAFIRVIVEVVQDSFFIPIAVLMALLTLRVIFRRPWIAYTVYFVVGGAVSILDEQMSLLSLGRVIALVIILAIVTRLGLFAFLVMVVFSYWGPFPLTIDSTSWFFTESVVTMVMFAAVAGYGFWVSLGGQKIIGELGLER